VTPIGAASAAAPPACASLRVPADAKPWDTICVNGKDMITDFDWVMSHPFNMLSRLPVIAIPNGIAENGLPTSIQIVSRSYDDQRAFRLARAIEESSPWLDCNQRRPLTNC
jgi:Asp-tRNA(Asn)/Glu-tRNA(Gln) amidotransferase A subunit family amidase